MSRTATCEATPSLGQLTISEDELQLLRQIAGGFSQPSRSNAANTGASGATTAVETADGTADGILPVLQAIREMERQPEGEPSAELAYWIDEYRRVGPRASYLWRWARRAVETTMLPCVAPEYREELCDTKTLGVMLDVLLDDVADRGGDVERLEELLADIERGPVDGASGGASDSPCRPQAGDEYADLTARLWRELSARARRYPRHDEFIDLLAYDYRQLCNVMRYSHLLNRHPELLNEAEHDLYTPHNMHIMICSTFDLMCSPTFDRDELGRLRELSWHTQCMGRIGNLVTTWEREVGDRDFTSGVFARAVSTGDLTADRLRTAGPDELVAAIRRGGHERYYLDRWQAHRAFLLERGRGLRSFDVRELVKSFEALICLHVGSRGKK